MRTKRRIVGGSLSSDMVTSLTTQCDRNLKANQIVGGGSRRKQHYHQQQQRSHQKQKYSHQAKHQQNVQLFDQYVQRLIRGGAKASQIIHSVQKVLQEKKHDHQMSEYLLSDYVQRHGGFQRSQRRQRRKRQQQLTRHRRQRVRYHQRGGADTDTGSSNTAVVDRPMETEVSYNYTDTNEYRGITGDSNILTGASNPPSMYQKFLDWFNGKTTIFTPSYADVTNNATAQLQCAGNSCAPITTTKNIVPNLSATTEIGTIIDPTVDGAAITTQAFPVVSDAGNVSIPPVLPTLNRA